MPSLGTLRSVVPVPGDDVAAVPVPSLGTLRSAFLRRNMSTGVLMRFA